MTTKLYHVICDRLRSLIAGTQWEGHLYAVGGCCRDEIMGYEIKDIDLAVDLPNGGVKFARWLQKRHLTIGKPVFYSKFGTAKLRLRAFPDDEIELVQTRKEQYTRETSRCPEVAFGTIEEDCYRRDFTVNSLYYDITRGNMVDITGLGIADMKAGLLRTPLDPDETFNDDPVRILRGLRFANRFGWIIDPPVMEAMKRHIHRIEIVSRERCHTEICKMLNGPDPVGMMETLRTMGVMQQMMPRMTAVTERPELWDAAMARLKKILELDPEAPTRFRLAAMMMDLASNPYEAAKKARRIMTELRFERHTVTDVGVLVAFGRIDEKATENQRRVREVQNQAVTPQRMRLLLRYLVALDRRRVSSKLGNTSKTMEHKGFKV